MQIHDREGNEVADIELSEKMQHALELGNEVAVIYHTPQLLRSTLGENAGSFTLRKTGDFVVAQDVATLRKYVDLQAAIKRAREQR